MTALKAVVRVQEVAEFPRLVAVTGVSGYLHLKACQAIKSAWEKLNVGDAQSVEGVELDQQKFTSLWSQVSLFEPESLYIVRRAGGLKNLASWLSAVKSPSGIKSHIVIDFADKIPADVQKQLTRLQAVVIQGVEPSSPAEFTKVAHALAKRSGIELDDDAMRLLTDSMGLDLGKVENELNNLSLRFAGQSKILSRADISGSIGSLREDDVFELFTLLRQKRSSAAHLMTEAFVTRGESAIAMTGIFARFARDQVEKGSLKKGLAGLRACAEADRRLKSSRIDDALVLSGVIESISEA